MHKTEKIPARLPNLVSHLWEVVWPILLRKLPVTQAIPHTLVFPSFLLLPDPSNPSHPLSLSYVMLLLHLSSCSHIKFASVHSVTFTFSFYTFLFFKATIQFFSETVFSTVLSHNFLPFIYRNKFHHTQMLKGNKFQHIKRSELSSLSYTHKN